MPTNQTPSKLLKLSLMLKEVKTFTLASIHALIWLCISAAALTIAFGIFKLIYLVVKYILVFEF